MHPLAQTTIPEIEQLVTCGMSEWEAIVAATANAAELCGAEAQLGTIEPGKLADLIVVPDSPLENIHNLAAVTMVIHNGHIVRGTQTV